MKDFSELQKLTDQILSQKDLISQRWVENKRVYEIFKRTGLNRRKFQKLFAPKVIDYFFSVANDKAKIGQCPIISVMLIIFDKLDIQLSDVFVICVHLKNLLNEEAVISSNEKLFSEINTIFDINFEGMIKEYMHIHYPALPKHKIDVAESENFYINKINANEFYEMEAVDQETIDDLNDFERDFEMIFYAEDRLSDKLISETNELLDSYLSILSRIVDFKELYAHISDFKFVLNMIDMKNISDKEAKIYYEIAMALISDLICWKNEVFVTKAAKDIHYLDDSIGSSVKQLQMLISHEESCEEDEIEFF